MKILGINFSDLVGHVFNGYDLHLDLLEKGIEASQIVLDKRSSSDSVKSLSKDLILHSQIREFEKQYSISNLMFPYGEEIINSFEFQTADLVHYHILHNGVVSLLDYPRLMNSRKSVWTIHDPWIITGNCVHPLTCERWKKGCGNCRRTNEIKQGTKYREHICLSLEQIKSKAKHNRFCIIVAISHYEEVFSQLKQELPNTDVKVLVLL